MDTESKQIPNFNKSTINNAPAWPNAFYKCKSSRVSQVTLYSCEASKTSFTTVKCQYYFSCAFQNEWLISCTAYFHMLFTEVVQTGDCPTHTILNHLAIWGSWHYKDVRIQLSSNLFGGEGRLHPTKTFKINFSQCPFVATYCRLCLDMLKWINQTYLWATTANCSMFPPKWLDNGLNKRSVHLVARQWSIHAHYTPSNRSRTAPQHQSTHTTLTYTTSSLTDTSPKQTAPYLLQLVCQYSNLEALNAI